MKPVLDYKKLSGEMKKDKEAMGVLGICFIFGTHQTNIPTAKMIGSCLICTREVFVTGKGVGSFPKEDPIGLTKITKRIFALSCIMSMMEQIEDALSDSNNYIHKDLDL